MTSNTSYSDDEIDIRALILVLVHHKWVILGVTLVVAAAVLIFSAFIQPKEYTGQAQVIITEPLYTTNLEDRILSEPQTPEGNILKDLSLAEDLLLGVYTSPEVTAVLDSDMEFDEFQEHLSAKLVGTTKLYLEVSSRSPDTAAIVVNVWADKFAAKINSLYSIDETALGKIENEVTLARQKWAEAQQDLLEKLPGGIVDMRKIELTSKHKALESYLNTLTQLDLLASDALSLQSRLAPWPDASQLGVEYQLSLLGLHQQAVGGLGGVQVQLTQPLVEGVKTVAEAKASLDALIASLDSQRAGLQADLDQIKQDITAATLALEAAQYHLARLTTERDLALAAYQALSAQYEETRIDLAREDLTAKIASRAIPPQRSVSPRSLMKTMLGGVLAFALACFGVLFVHWWKTPASA